MTDNPARTAVAPPTGDQLSRLSAIGSEHAAAAREVLFLADSSYHRLAFPDGYVDIVERRCYVVIGPPHGADSSLAADQS